MTRWLPFPLLSAALLLMWLLLNRTLSPGHFILGSVLAVFGGWMLTALEPPKATLRRPLAIVVLAFLVLTDIIRSNIAVARIIFAGRHRQQTAGFMDIPLDMRAPHGLAVLAIIITSTPGTLWAHFDTSRGLLTIHVLDLIDEAAWVSTIKNRYERLLMRIFE